MNLQSIVDGFITAKLGRVGLYGAVKNVEWAIFYSAGEGIEHRADPPFEEQSGMVVTKEGKVYGYWVGWDHLAERPCLTEWSEWREEEVRGLDPRNESEVREAFERVGVDPEAICYSPGPRTAFRGRHNKVVGP